MEEQGFTLEEHNILTRWDWKLSDGQPFSADDVRQFAELSQRHRSGATAQRLAEFKPAIEKKHTKKRGEKPVAKTIKTTKTTLTKAQERGLAALGDAESGGDGKVRRKRRKKSLTMRAVRKVGKKHKITKVGVFLAVGLLEVGGKAIKYGGKGVGHVGKIAGHKALDKAKRDVRYRKWTHAPAPRTNGKWYEPTLDLTCCGDHYNSFESLNRHLVSKHRGEKRQVVRKQPKIHRSHTAKTAGRTIVRPKVAGGGRHRARHNLPDAKRVTDLIAAYQKEIAAVRERVEEIMADESATQAILRNAGAAIGDIRVTGKTKLSDFYALLVGMEMGFNAIADGVADFGQMLRSERGANIDPALVRPFMDKAVEQIQETGATFTRFVAAFSEVYALHIKAERGELSKPNMNLAS